MPHIIFSGTPDFELFHNQFEPYKGTSNDWLLKIQHCYISESGKTLIFDCTAVRSGFSQDFYIRAEKKDDRVTVRVDPYMRIEKNEGVQRAIYDISVKLKGLYPGLVISKTNLPENLSDFGILH